MLGDRGGEWLAPEELLSDFAALSCSRSSSSSSQSSS